VLQSEIANHLLFTFSSQKTDLLLQISDCYVTTHRYEPLITDK